MERIVLILLLLSVFTPADLYRSLPSEVKGWKADGEDLTFDRNTLYRHINGGAELYLTYDFREVIVRRFEHPDKPGMLLEVFDMGSPAEAFGIFSCERDGDSLAIGQGAEYAGGLFRMWKDRYFVSITSLGNEEYTRSAIAALGKTIADMIASIGPLPPLIDRLPALHLRHSTIRYFHASQPLNNIYYLASENILLLGENTDCLFARYFAKESLGRLLLIDYHDAPRALAAHESFIAQYLPEAAKTGYARMEDGTYTAVRVQNNFLAIVFESRDAESAVALLTGVNFDE
jgi:hypothetical protein